MVGPQLAEYLAGVLTRLRGTEYIASLCTEMHSRGAFPGQSWRAHIETFRRYIPDSETRTIMDFGCGPGGGLLELFGDRVVPYDPFVERYSTPPWDRAFDVVFSTDVLEHMTRAQVEDFLARVRRSGASYVFLNVSTRPAYKRLPNGANAHITVQPARWWLDRISESLGPDFEPTLALQDMLRHVATFCFHRI